MQLFLSLLHDNCVSTFIFCLLGLDSPVVIKKKAFCILLLMFSMIIEQYCLGAFVNAHTHEIKRLCILNRLGTGLKVKYTKPVISESDRHGALCVE